MGKSIKVVDIAQDASNENEEGKTQEDVTPEVVNVVDDVAEVVSEVVKEVVSDEGEPETAKVEDKPKKMITCPDCGKYMLERTFRSKHIKICGKPKVPRARPIEEVIKEKREKAVASPLPKMEPKPKPVEHKPIEPLPPPPPVKPDYWDLRREYTNQLNERRNQMIKRLASKAF